MAVDGLKGICVFSLSLAMLGVGGCTQLQSYGGSLWQKSQFLGNAVATLLRPAPKQEETFLAGSTTPSNNPNSQITKVVNVLDYPPNDEMAPVLLTSLRGASDLINTPQTFKSSTVAVPIIPIFTASLQKPILPPHILPVIITIPKMKTSDMLAGAPSKPKKITLRKIHGATEISDLTGCAETAGKTLVESFTGYQINPDFLACMNDNGYALVDKIEA